MVGFRKNFTFLKWGFVEGCVNLFIYLFLLYLTGLMN